MLREYGFHANHFSKVVLCSVSNFWGVGKSGLKGNRREGRSELGELGTSTGASVCQAKGRGGVWAEG